MIYEGVTIEKLAHDTFMLGFNNKKIYIDPYSIPEGSPKADLVLITHGHYDHCSIEDLKKIADPSTTVIATPDCISKLANLKLKQLKVVEPGEKVGIMEMIIEAVPAYNVDKQFHPKAQGWVGYIITINKKRIYHAGDTDYIPEMDELKNIDVALLPVSGTYVMTAEEASKACNAIKPKLAIPMHYGTIVGKTSDAEHFKQLAKCKVEIL